MQGESASDPDDLNTGGQGKLQRGVEMARDVYHQNVGLLLVAGAQLFLSFMNVAVKKLNRIDPPVTALQLIIVRMSITWICSVTFMLATGVPDPLRGPEGVRLLFVVRGLSGFFGLFGIYFSLKYLSLSDATVLTFLSPLCTAAAGALLLGEKFSRKEAFAGLVSLCGVVLIARPPFIFGNDNKEPTGGILEISAGDVTPEQRLAAVGMGLVGVLGATGAYTSLRAIGKRAHPLHSLVMFSFYSVAGASIGMIATDTPFIVPTRLEWLGMLIMIGVFGFFAQILLTMGLARETAGRASMGMYSQIVFATILERVFFHTVPSVPSFIGTFMIISCALYVALTKKSSPSPRKEAKKPVVLRDEERGLLERRSEDSDAQKGI